MRTKAWAGVVALLLLVGSGACGDDDAEGTGPDPFGGQGDANAGDAGGGSSEGDPCSLLDVSEIEAEFGDRGAVADGEALGISCSWEVGEISDSGSGVVGVTRAGGAGSAEESIAEVRDLSSDPVEVQGLGDEAFFDSGMLWFRVGDQVVSVSAFFTPEVDGVQEKLTSLAELILERV